MLTMDGTSSLIGSAASVVTEISTAFTSMTATLINNQIFQLTIGIALFVMLIGVVKGLIERRHV